MKGVGMQHRGGFTLIELLVVLSILGALAIVAVRSLSGIQDQKRREITVDVLHDVDDAVTGESGFLSDLGRLPGGIGDSLQDLWQQPKGVAASHLATDSIDPEITMAVGWRGPYMVLLPGATELLDGFGFPLEVSAPPGHWSVVSRGADDQQGGMDYNADLDLVLIDTASGIDRTRSELAGQVEVRTPPAGDGTPWTVDVFAYVPDPATGELLAVHEDPDDENPDLGSSPVLFHYRFSANALTPGRRLIRAYARAKTDPNPRPGISRSPIRTIDLRAGAQNLDLVIE